MTPDSTKDQNVTGIDPTTYDELRQIAARYPHKRSGLLPMLHLVQSAQGRITPEGIEACAEILEITAAEVSGVATFYTMYKRKPVGDYHVGVCTNTLCAIMGGDAILEALETDLGVHAGQTTGDGLITLEHIECNAACDYAPVVMVNWEFFDNQTPTSARELVESIRAGQTPQPTRGAPVCPFTQTARTLAGVGPQTADTTGPGAATLAGLRVAREQDES